LAGYRKGAVVNGDSQFWNDESQNFEIVSLVGTLESSSLSQVENEMIVLKNSDIDFNDVYGHIHISVADSTGLVRGGHLMSGCIVYTTAEVVLMEMDTIQFSRRPCSMSGYDELHVSSRNNEVPSIRNIITLIAHFIQNFFQTFIFMPIKWILSPLTSKY
jgi:predicted DNA-binding protein with PD1-like motif